MAGAPIGNSNATKTRPWAAAIERALVNRSRIDQKQALDELAEQLLKQCDAGDMTALKELGDRLDGKAKQSVDHSESLSNVSAVDLARLAAMSEADLDRLDAQLKNLMRS